MKESGAVLRLSRNLGLFQREMFAVTDRLQDIPNFTVEEP